MMVLSRIWYVLLSFVLGMALYAVFLAVGQYNRRNTVAMTEELASDSQTVGWALQLDSRKRLDAMLLGSVDKPLQDALANANGKDKIPAKAKDDARKALSGVAEKIAAEWRSDALFAVDHEGRVVAEIGFDQANADDFELGGYPAVFDALHGFLRDDTWVLGGKIYRVVARPVEFDVTQPPLGAIVGLRAVDAKFAQELTKKTRTNIAFYAGGQKVAGAAATEGFDANALELIAPDLAQLGADKSYADGRSDVRALPDNANYGVMYARLFGDAWDLGAGFAVVRPRVVIAGPMGFLSGADDKDKQGVNFPIIALAVLLGIAGGIGLSLLEHSMPLKEMQLQAAKLKKGELDYLQPPRFRGGYRGIAQDVNAGIERVLEKGGGAVRKPADLESILGPVPAQPAMSAFSFPLHDGSGPPSPGRPAPAYPGFGPPNAGPGVNPPGPQGGAFNMPPPREPQPTRPGVPPNAPQSRPGFPNMQGPPPAQATMPVGGGGGPPMQPQQQPPMQPYGGGPPAFGAPGGFASAQSLGAPQGPSPFASAGQPQPRPRTAAMGAPSPAAQNDSDFQDGPTIAAQSPFANSPGAAPPPGAPPLASGGPLPAAPRPRQGSATMLGMGLQAQQALNATPQVQVPAAAPGQSAALAPPTTPNAFFPPPPRGPSNSRPQIQTTSYSGTAPAPTSTPSGRQLPEMTDDDDDEKDEATVVAAAPSELLAQASGENKSEAAEWMVVYEDFVRTKKQCGEPTEGLTFEKFQHTLRKNRDALMQRHNCKRVKFAVYVKEGRASLKATPVRE